MPTKIQCYFYVWIFNSTLLTIEAIQQQSDELHLIASHSPENLDVRVYRRVIDAILKNKLRPGSKLNEEELADIFDVSRSIIRKTLTRLAHDGIVEARKNRGTSIAIISAAEAKEIFTARKFAEVAIAGMACRHFQPEHSRQLQQLIDDELSAKEAGDFSKALYISSEFHFKIAEIAGNKPLADFSHNLVSRCSLIIAQFERPGTPLCHLEHEHRNLIDALESGDEETAKVLMYEHIQHIEGNIDLANNNTSANLNHVFSTG